MNDEILKMHILNCQIFIGNNVFDEIKSFFEVNNFKSSDIYILVDENTRKYCLPDIINKINAFDQSTIIEIKSGEEHKNIDTALLVWKRMLELGADRNAILVNLGGGVICDVGGFIASLYKRGIKFINIPTTLMSQVDAGFGGKTGVDMDGMKNQIGLFSNAEAVFIYPKFINSLNKRQKLSGFAEIIKHSIISNLISLEDLIDFDFENDGEINKLICNSVITKGRIVVEDYKENSIRKTLNFGHTIGHAIESYSLLNDKEPLMHGEALAIGIICEIFLSVKHKNFPKTLQQKVNSFIIDKFGRYNINNTAYDSLISMMLNDKKNHNREISFVLVAEIGKPFIDQYCNNDEIAEALDFYNNL